jgi:cytochrome c peroxidase
MKRVGIVFVVALALYGGSAPDARQDHAGRRLFNHETFGGNGRTCRTCHSPANGTLTLEQIADRFAEDPDGPLFRGDGTDDGAGNGTTRIRTDGTILITLPLPSHVRLADNPAATTVTFRRGIPSTMNTPALDPVLMYDGRAIDLIDQARGAVIDHAANTIEPSIAELEAIAEFQKTRQFFTSPALRRFADGGPPPTLPAGRTASERRGRRFFDDVPVTATSTRGMCALCHSGPMLNESNGFNPIPIPPFFVPKGERFQSILSGELLPNGDAFRPYLVTNPDGSTFVSVSSDPGRAMVTGDFRGFPFGDLGEFKIPTLWNVRHTAPYFHNNGAKTLEDVVRHYQAFFAIAVPVVFPGADPLVFSEQDLKDLVAFLKLL